MDTRRAESVKIWRKTHDEGRWTHETKESSDKCIAKANPLFDILIETWPHRWRHYVSRPDSVCSKREAVSNVNMRMKQHCLALTNSFVFGATALQWARASSFTRFIDHTRNTTVSRTPLDEWSARRRDLYLTTHNTHNRHPCLPVGFEPAIPAGERQQTYALDRVAIGTGKCWRMANTI